MTFEQYMKHEYPEMPLDYDQEVVAIRHAWNAALDEVARLVFRGSDRETILALKSTPPNKDSSRQEPKPTGEGE